MIDPMIHSLRWVRAYPFLARAEAEIWRDDFDPVAKWVNKQIVDFAFNEWALFFGVSGPRATGNTQKSEHE